MSAAADREKDADDQIRLVSLRAHELLKTSSTARKVFGADVVDSPSNLSSVGKGSSASVCAGIPTTSMSSDYEIAETSPAVTSTSEPSTVSVCDAQIVQENQFRGDRLTSTNQFHSTPRSSSPLPAQSVAVPNEDIKPGQMHIEADISSSVVINQTSPCASLSTNNSASEDLELLKNSCQLDKRDTSASSPSQVIESDKLNTDSVTTSNNCRKSSDGNLSLPTTQRICSNEGIDEQADQMASKDNDLMGTNTSTVDGSQKTMMTLEAVVESSRPAESTEVETVSELIEKNREQSIGTPNCTVFRNATGKTISRKPSRIVSFTAEDFDLFQSKYLVPCNLAIIFCMAY